jgi:hypothetical protein
MPSKKPSKVAIIGADWPAYERFCPNFTGMQIGLKNLEIEHKLFGCRPVLNVEAVIEYQPDLVVYGLLDMVRAHATRMEIRKALPDAKIVMWYGDLRKRQFFADMSEIDAMFVSNDAQSRFYEKVWRVPKCHFLPLGAPVYNPPVLDRLSRDFIFVGAMNTGELYGWRSELMMHLQKNAGLLVVNADAELQPRRRAQILKDLPSLYRSSKISLDVSHFTDIQGYTSNRFWIITAAGGFALTKRWPGCTDFYPEGTRAYFDSPEEAVELKNYYLAHPEEREKIRAAGHTHSKHHTYENRFATMFEILYVSNSEDRLRIPVSQASRSGEKEIL